MKFTYYVKTKADPDFTVKSRTLAGGVGYRVYVKVYAVSDAVCPEQLD